MSITRWIGLTAGLCAVLGVGIATSSAAPTRAKARDTAAAFTTSADHDATMDGGMPVHGELTVLDEAGDAYITQTLDEGTVDSVSNTSMTIKEGTKAVPYRTVTLKLPEDATVFDGFDRATLADVKTGEAIHVMQSSEKTVVIVGVPGDGMGGYEMGGMG